MACLSILEGKNVKKIYCEFHDDFVIENVIDDVRRYVFIQVKTKRKLREIWGINEVFGILKKETKKNIQSDEPIRDSFVGKLLLHTINFSSSCEKVVFMTNTHVDDDIETLLEDLEANINGKHSSILVNKFNDCFVKLCDANHSGPILSKSDVQERLKKLSFETDVEYLKEKFYAFESLARNAIYKYSEIDLEHSEVNEIVISLLNLVNKKSSRKLDKFSEDDIDSLTAIGIDDLLGILSISKKAYYDLLQSGDEKAIKSASVIERTLKRAGSSDAEIQFCSECKIKWDGWVRHNRHILNPLDFNSIDGHFETILSKLSMGGMIIRLSLLRTYTNELKSILEDECLLFDLDDAMIVGGIFSKVVGYEK